MAIELEHGWQGGDAGRARFGLGVVGEAFDARVPFRVGYCYGVDTDDRALVLLGGGMYRIEIAAGIDRTTLSGNRVAVVGNGPATWLVVGVYATS